MKALTLTQPWATLVAHAQKCVETRSWKPGYHFGPHCPIAIHASASFPKGDQVLARCEPFRSVLALCGYDDPQQLPLGVLLAVVEIIKLEPTEVAAPAISEHELAFGNYRPGRWAWYLRRLAQLPEPIKIRGALGLWETDDTDPHDGTSRSNVTSLIYIGSATWTAFGGGKLHERPPH